MIKAVFFDLYNTVVRFDPPREELQATACRELGIEVEPEVIRKVYWLADDLMAKENARFPIESRSEEEKRRFWCEYESMLLKAAGVEVSTDLAFQIISRLRKRPWQFILFDDVIPTLSNLKSRGLILGLLSNIHRDLERICTNLGVALYFDFLLTSREVGVEKPHALIFLAALERAQVQASEAIHVGDQYHSDVVGARAVGIKPLLLDRDGFLEGFSDCLRIRSLSEVVDYL